MIQGGEYLCGRDTKGQALRDRCSLWEQERLTRSIVDHFWAVSVRGLRITSTWMSALLLSPTSNEL